MSHVAAVLLAWEGVSKVAREMDRTFDHDASHRTWYLMWPALAGSVESDCRVLDDLDPLVVLKPASGSGAISISSPPAFASAGFISGPAAARGLFLKLARIRRPNDSAR